MNGQDGWMLYWRQRLHRPADRREARRRGLRPVLAGRDGPRIAAWPLGWSARPGLPAPFGQGHCGRVGGLRAVMHCAGPFSATAAPMMDACLAAGVDYLDITGEIDVIVAAAARTSGRWPPG